MNIEEIQKEYYKQMEIVEIQINNLKELLIQMDDIIEKMITKSN